MKIKHKKLAASGTAIVLAGVLGIGALLQTSVSVQASSVMMPGIEEIVNDTAGSSEPFKILEIVDKKEEAELGYYVSGQEPYIKLYEYHYQDSDGNEKMMTFETLDDGLSKLPEKERYEFARNVKLNDDGSINTDESTGIKNVQNVSYIEGSSQEKEEDYPLSYTPYQEKYFLGTDDNEKEWTKVNFVDADNKSRTDTVSLEGSYQENSSGKGNYTKEEQVYYPIRSDKTDDQNRPNKYRENIENFYYSDSDTAQAPYFLEFEPVANELVNDAIDQKKQDAVIGSEYDYNEGKYGYYENVYADLTEEMLNNIEGKTYTFPGEKPSKPDNFDKNSLPIQSNTSTQSDAFSEGEEGEFSSVNETAAATATGTTDFENGQDNEFGDGSFSSGEEGGIDESVSSADSSAIQSDSAPQTTDSSEPSATDDISDGAQSTGNTAEQALGDIGDKENQGKQSDPYIYLSENIDKYPYYKYTLLGDLSYVKNKVQECKNNDADAQANQTEITRTDGDITLENGQYWYWKANTQTKDFDKIPLSIVTGRQPVAYSDVRKIDTNIITYNYYYRVKNVYFCCVSKDSGNNPDDFQYFGWYYPSYPQNQDVYIKVNADDGKVPTHYISDAEYKLTPEKGEFDFIPGDGETQAVQVNHMYYKGGYTNHDWFKKFVFHLSDSSDEAAKKQFDDFNIEVDTITAEKFNERYGSTSMSVSEENTEAAGIADSDITENDDIADEAGTNTEETEVDMGIDGISDIEEQSEGETSEVDSMISEAGVELVSIENEISDDAANEFQDGTDSASTAENVETQEAEVLDSDVLSAGAADSTFSDGDSGESAAFSTGDTGISQNKLSQYHLIYLNGQINSTGASNITSTMIPCIINSRLFDLETTEWEGAFSTAIDENNGNRHYVSKRYYFFRNLYDTENTSGLINIQFDENFNTNDSELSSGDQTIGFEEILSYIENENQYRKMESDNTGNVVELLDTKISQARVIEYIVNYNYKRAENTKKELSVLEIEPTKLNEANKLNDSRVIGWLKNDSNAEAKIKKNGVEVCCYDKKENHPGNLLADGDATTFWHSNWNKSELDSNTKLPNDGNHDAGHHWFKVTLEEAQTINRFDYLPRKYLKNGDQNGKLISFNLYFYNENGTLIKEISGNFKYKDNDDKDDTQQRFYFDAVENVSQIKVEYLTTTYLSANKDEKNASCAEVGFGYSGDIPSSVEVKTMTSSEYVGHIDDINSKYDIIYIGDTCDTPNTDITGDNGTLYSHVGAEQKAKTFDKNNTWKLMGQFPEDFNSDGSLNTNSKTNSFRGSGNDITMQQYKELMSFVKSGYPVVLGDSLITGKEVNTKKVDNSSYMYKFLKDAIKFSNVMTESELEKANSKITFYSTLAKPEIQFSENGMPPEAPRDNHYVGEKIYDSDNKEINTYNYISGEITYRFTIKNNSDISPANTRYDCRLYFDLNFDGNLSDLEEQASYIEIKDSSQTVQPRIYSDDGKISYYSLKADEEYTLTRKIPSDYYKLIAWKLEIVNTSNTNVRTSVMGYAKQKNTSKNKVKINILQIAPDTTCSANAQGRANGTWNLQNELKNETGIYEHVKDLEDFEISKDTVTTITVTEFDKDPDKNLNDKQMVIIGFDDVYQNISVNGVKAIKKFIMDGKSVIFSHDTTSFYTYKYDKNNNVVNGQWLYTNWLINTVQRTDWGVSMNTVLREIVGMDRYGITSDRKFSDENRTVSSLLKQGNDLSDGNGVSFKELMELAGDIAYTNGSGCATSYRQTQGYTNGQIEGFDAGSGDNTVVNATKVNDGAITQYPYIIKDNATIASTHMQYYQLALEQDRDINGVSDGKNDIVVWYCLGSTKGNKGQVDKYANSPNDVRNYYYFYSKGNVIYTGAGHSAVKDPDEIKLFVNAMIAAANVAAVDPDVNFVKSLNSTNEKEKVRYYVTNQPNYNSSDASILETNQEIDLYFNVKDYNMVNMDLNSKKDQNMTVDLYIQSDNGQVLDDAPNEMKNVKVLNLNEAVKELIPYGNQDNPIELKNGVFYLSDNNTYGFKITDIEGKHYLENPDGSFKATCKVYVKVTSTVNLYGKDVTSTSWASIDLKQRQLFDLD